MIKIGITGQSGFVGTHLYNALSVRKDKYLCVPFEDAYFQDDNVLRDFVKQCDVIVHLAAMMRSPKEGEVYEINMRLVHQLIEAMDAENVSPSIFFSSSIQEGNGSEYGRCKQEGRELLMNWAIQHNTGFGGMLFPNLFGPGARPYSHSFIATFCYQLTHGETPNVLVDNTVRLKYINNLVEEVKVLIDLVVMGKGKLTCSFEPDFSMKVTEVLRLLESFKDSYSKNETPIVKTQSEQYLLDTFNSYKNYDISQ